MSAEPDLLLIGDGRLARHLACYFDQLGLRYVAWSRRGHAEGRSPDLRTLVRPSTHALLAISDSAIESFIASHRELDGTVRVHFSGGLTTRLAFGAHPLFSFAASLYSRELYERILFVVDDGAPSLKMLIPGLPNAEVFIDVQQRARYHALCVLAGNFTTLLWRKFFFTLETEFGIGRDQALPYLESVARGLGGDGAPLSGPLSRGDHVTIQRNLEALEGDPFEGVYRAFLSAYERQGQLGRNWLAP